MQKILARTVFLSALLVAAVASSSTVVGYSFSELCSHANAIVRGRVIAQQSQWVDGRIMTEVTIEVLESVKGDHQAGQTVVVLNHGGAVDNLATWVPGAPVFTDAEEVILFLERSPEHDTPLVLGLGQGKFSVTTDPETGGRFVQRSLEGLELVDLPQVDGRAVTPSVADLEIGELGVPIETFMGVVTSALEVTP